MNNAQLRKEIGRRIMLTREILGITQKELSIKTQHQQAAISHFECGRRTPNALNIFKLCKALNCSADYLLGLKP